MKEAHRAFDSIVVRPVNGNIVNPGDLHGRVLPADQVDLCWDGNQISALVGPDLVEGVSGFGNTVPDALRELADELVGQAVWIEIAGRDEPLFDLVPASGTVIHTNVVELFHDEDQICALAASFGSNAGVAAFGESVHDAIRRLAELLVEQGVWVEGSERREWHFERIDEHECEDKRETALLHSAWGAPHCSGRLLVLTEGDRAEIVCGECRGLVFTGRAVDLPVTLDRMEHTRITTLPHQVSAIRTVGGCLNAIFSGDKAEIRCGECDALISTVPAADVEQTLTQMELTLDCSTEMCPHCGKANVISGFSTLMAYTCRECGEVVRLSDDSDVDRIFGSEP